MLCVQHRVARRLNFSFQKHSPNNINSVFSPLRRLAVPTNVFDLISRLASRCCFERRHSRNTWVRVQSSSNCERTLLQGLIRELRILKDKVEQLEDQKLQYEKKLKATKVRKKVMNFLWPLQRLTFFCRKTAHLSFLNAVQSDRLSGAFCLRTQHSSGLALFSPP